MSSVIYSPVSAISLGVVDASNLWSGLCWLRRHPEIMHSDVSISNIMVRRVSGKVYGVLNDFDLARIRGFSKMSSQRTGTQPFMAIDLLRPSERSDEMQTHLPRFDLESLFYVLLWRACCPNDKVKQHIRLPTFPKPGGRNRDHDHHELKTWRTVSWSDLQEKKQALVTRSTLPILAPDFKTLGAALIRIGNLLNKGLSTRRDYRNSGFLAELSGGSAAILDYNDRWLGECFTEANVKDALWASSLGEREVWGWPSNNSIDLNEDPDFYRSA